MGWVYSIKKGSLVKKTQMFCSINDMASVETLKPFYALYTVFGKLLLKSSRGG